ncbi:hypothetical protein CTAM01_14685, partial [Colletotrichum tamarilloi]
NTTTQHAAHVPPTHPSAWCCRSASSSLLCACKEQLDAWFIRRVSLPNQSQVTSIGRALVNLSACSSNVRYSNGLMRSGPDRFLLVPRLPKSPDCRHANNFVMWQVPARPPASPPSSFSHLSPRPLCVSHNSTRRRDAQHVIKAQPHFFVVMAPDFVRRSYCAATKQFRHRSRVPRPLLHAFMSFARLRVMISRIIREPFSSSPDSLAAASHVPNVCLIALCTDQRSSRKAGQSLALPELRGVLRVSLRNQFESLCDRISKLISTTYSIMNMRSQNKVDLFR